MAKATETPSERNRKVLQAYPGRPTPPARRWTRRRKPQRIGGHDDEFVADFAHDVLELMLTAVRDLDAERALRGIPGRVGIPIPDPEAYRSSAQKDVLLSLMSRHDFTDAVTVMMSTIGFLMLPRMNDDSRQQLRDMAAVVRRRPDEVSPWLNPSGGTPDEFLFQMIAVSRALLGLDIDWYRTLDEPVSFASADTLMVGGRKVDRETFATCRLIGDYALCNLDLPSRVEKLVPMLGVIQRRFVKLDSAKVTAIVDIEATRKRSGDADRLRSARVNAVARLICKSVDIDVSLRDLNRARHKLRE